MKLKLITIFMCAFLFCLASHFLDACSKSKLKSKSNNIPFGLSFFYNNFVGTALRPLLTKKWFSWLAGNYADCQISKYHIKSFVKNHTINMDEAEHPASTYHSFNDFFTRKLKPNARTIDRTPQTLTCPADGALLVINLHKQNNFEIKETSFNLRRFLADPILADAYAGGTLLIFRLAPWDYHRYHFPFDCTPSKPTQISGIYESVHPLVYSSGIQPLTENERQLIELKSDTREMLMISVGALCVGKIHHTYTPQKKYKKGDETGYFSFGGSTVVLVCKPNTVTINAKILKNSAHKKETPVKMGEPIALFVQQ